MPEQDSDEIGWQALMVLYDPVNGKIAHVHYAGGDQGSKRPTRETLEQEALEYAARVPSVRARRFNVKKLSFLHLDPETFKTDRVYKVDIKKRILVEVKRGRSR